MSLFICGLFIYLFILKFLFLFFFNLAGWFWWWFFKGMYFLATKTILSFPDVFVRIFGEHPDNSLNHWKSALLFVISFDLPIRSYFMLKLLFSD